MYPSGIVKREEIEVHANELLVSTGLHSHLYVAPKAVFAALKFKFVLDAPPACRGVALIAKGVVRVAHSRVPRRQDEEYGHEAGHLVCVLGGESEPHDEMRIVRPAGLAIRIPRVSMLRTIREERRDARVICAKFSRISKLEVLQRIALTGEFDVFIRTGERLTVLAAEQPTLAEEMEIHQIMDAAQVLGRVMEDERGTVAVEMRVGGKLSVVAVVPRE